MVKISRNEMLYMQSHGVPFGENGISHTNGNHRRSYYVTETQRCMWLLNDYRNQKIVGFAYGKD